MTAEPCGCARRVEALEASVEELRRELADVDLADLAELIEEALTSA